MDANAQLAQEIVGQFSGPWRPFNQHTDDATTHHPIANGPPVHDSAPASAFDLRLPADFHADDLLQSSVPSMYGHQHLSRAQYMNHHAQHLHKANPVGNAAESQQPLAQPFDSSGRFLLQSQSALSALQQRSQQHHDSSEELDLDSILSGPSDTASVMDSMHQYHYDNTLPQEADQAVPEFADLSGDPNSLAPAPPADSAEVVATPPISLLETLIEQEKLLDFAATGCKLKVKLDQESRDDGFLRTLDAVAKIVHNKLYLARARNMETYFQGQYKISRAQVYRLLDCWTVIRGLDGLGELPLKQRICRTIKKLAPEAEKRRILWKAVLDEYSVTKNVSNLTSADIRNKHNELAKTGVFDGFKEVPESVTGGERRKRRRKATESDGEHDEMDLNSEAGVQHSPGTSAASSTTTALVLDDLGMGNQDDQHSAPATFSVPLSNETGDDQVIGEFSATTSGGAVVAAHDTIPKLSPPPSQPIEHGEEIQRPTARRRHKSLAATASTDASASSAPAPTKAKRGRKPKSSATPAMHPCAALLHSTPLSIGPMAAYAAAGEHQEPAPETPGHLAIVIKPEPWTTGGIPASSPSPCPAPEQSFPLSPLEVELTRVPLVPMHSTLPTGNAIADVMRVMSFTPETESLSPVALGNHSQPLSASERASSVASSSPTTLSMALSSSPQDDASFTTRYNTPGDHDGSGNDIATPASNAVGHVDQPHQESPPTHPNTSAAQADRSVSHHDMPPAFAHAGQVYYISTTNPSHSQFHPTQSTQQFLFHPATMDPRHPAALHMQHYPYFMLPPNPLLPQARYVPPAHQGAAEVQSQLAATTPHVQGVSQQHAQHLDASRAITSPTRRPLWTPYGDPWYS